MRFVGVEDEVEVEHLRTREKRIAIGGWKAETHLLWIFRRLDHDGLVARKSDRNTTLGVIDRAHFFLFALIERSKTTDDTHRTFCHD